MIGILWKIIPVATGFFFAVSHPDVSQEIYKALTPIAYFIKDAIVGGLAFLGGLIWVTVFVRESKEQ